MPLPTVLPNQDCAACRKSDWRFSRVIALGTYQGKLRQAVIMCKKQLHESLRYAVTQHMADRVMQQIPEIVQQNPLIVPVPNYWLRSLFKTKAAAISLGELLSRHTGWPLATGMIRRIRRTQKQGMLSITERRENVRGAFLNIRHYSLTGRHVLIVDDVLTSGATVNELARQLRRSRPADISAVVIARATGRGQV
ncbi:MAG: ComF family protein [Pirellulaceae bacterium]|nr:ComF family protein [Pirellulaceae bacterium]